MDLDRTGIVASWISPAPNRLSAAAGAFLTVGAAIAAFFMATGNAIPGAIVGAITFLVAIRLAVDSDNAGRLTLLAELLLVGWFGLAPLADYYLRFPFDRAVVTFDRLIFGSVTALLAFSFLISRSSRSGQSRGGTAPTPAVAEAIGHFDISRFELVWIFLALLSLVSVAFKSHDLQSGLKISVDGFCLPLLAFHLTRYHFRTERHSKALLLSGMAVAFFLVATGGWEFLTGRDLFAYPGSQLIREGELRVNGPFTSDTSLEVVSLLLAVFLRAAPRVFSIRFDRSGRIIYWAAVTAAVIAAMLPQSRGIGIALVLSWIVLEILLSFRFGIANPESEAMNGIGHASSANPSKSGMGRTIRLALVIAGAVVLLLAGAALLNPNSYEQRLLSSRNVFSRLATWRVGLKVTSISPITGVGLGNYNDVFEEVYSNTDREAASGMDTKVAVGPHSNPMWILSELGIPALGLYLLAFAMLLIMSWKALSPARAAPARKAAACLIAVLVAYWIPGLSLASGYYADINLYFFFVAGALSSRFADRDLS